MAAPSSVIEIDEVLDARIVSGAGHPVEALEQIAFRVRILDDRFDDVVGIDEILERRGHAQAAERAVAIGHGEFSLVHELREAGTNLCLRAVEHRPGDVDEPYVETGLRKDLRDPVPHRPRAHDTNGFDHRFIATKTRRTRSNTSQEETQKRRSTQKKSALRVRRAQRPSSRAFPRQARRRCRHRDTASRFLASAPGVSVRRAASSRHVIRWIRSHDRARRRHR